ncbi:REG-2-like, HAD superfamily (subfamily IA) hydrolase [Thalassoporum mexicanum PCC 7367]|uniref:HAD-IA family hydrolase n=1 Tax=Thalassoporum mexicanum TaxID=3457544 RepID=UPI00029F939F|nr:HAD-IA family hydrolase [Pseudanabaena sp. PCC 7367]AFY69224.1 REG-2-like, HAD superfamily (subfamily IA) hydrolase [Pseudanabaena sp. PCC 7367]
MRLEPIKEVEPSNQGDRSPVQSQPSIIFLDAVGTLFGVKGSVGQNYALVAGEFGVDAIAADLDRAFVKYFRAAPRMAFPGAEPNQIPALEKQWWFELAIDTFTEAGIYSQFTDFAKFFDRLYQFFAGADPWQVYPDTMPALEHWQAQGIKLGVVSNFDTRLYPVLAALGLADFFSSVTISTEAGAAKPDPGVFKQALRKYPDYGAIANSLVNNSNPEPKAIWHIGDSLSEDYAGAIAANLEAIWINRGDRLPENHQALKSVTKLTDLIVA